MIDIWSCDVLVWVCCTFTQTITGISWLWWSMNDNCWRHARAVSLLNITCWRCYVNSWNRWICSKYRKFVTVTSNVSVPVVLVIARWHSTTPMVKFWNSEYFRDSSFDQSALFCTLFVTFFLNNSVVYCVIPAMLLSLLSLSRVTHILYSLNNAMNRPNTCMCNVTW